MGCALSLVAVTITMAVHGGVAKLRQTLPSQLLLGLCASLAVSLTFFIIASYIATSPVPTSCQAVAVVLHYAILASFGWMVVQGLHLYAVVVIVLGLRMEHRLRLYTIFALGM